jgi:hypothetical protein
MFPLCGDGLKMSDALAFLRLLDKGFEKALFILLRCARQFADSFGLFLGNYLGSQCSADAAI